MSAGGVLEFSLGLGVNDFLKGCKLGETAVLGLELSFEALHKAAEASLEGIKWAFEKTWGQIERGAALNDFSKRTGESVANLFMLQKGFAAAGVSAESLGPALFLLNKSLGGVNEAGEKTDSVFETLGLSVEKLKEEGGAAAFIEVLEKIGTLNQSSATKAASLIFGRGVAADVVQLSRSVDELKEAMAGAKAQAEVFQKVAAVFDYIEKAAARVKAKLDPLFLEIAARLAPAFKFVLDAFNSFDITPIAQAAGNIITVLTEAFREGRITELLTSGLKAALEAIENIIMGSLGSGGFWSGVWEVMVASIKAQAMVAMKVLINAVILGASLIQHFLLKVIEVFGNKLGNTPIGKALGLGGMKAGSFEDTFANNRKNAGRVQDALSGTLFGDIGQMMEGIKKQLIAVGKAATAGGPAEGRFGGLIQELLINAGVRPDEVPGGGKTGRGLDVLFGETAGKNKKEGGGGERTNASELERMGFVLNNGAATDHAATVARNTGRTCELLEKLVDGVEQITNLDLSSKRPQDPTLDHGLDLRTKLELDLPNA